MLIGQKNRSGIFTLIPKFGTQKFGGSISELDKLWDHPDPHIMRTQVAPEDIDGLNHTNNAAARSGNIFSGGRSSGGVAC